MAARAGPALPERGSGARRWRGFCARRGRTMRGDGRPPLLLLCSQSPRAQKHARSMAAVGPARVPIHGERTTSKLGRSIVVLAQRARKVVWIFTLRAVPRDPLLSGLQRVVTRAVGHQPACPSLQREEGDVSKLGGSIIVARRPQWDQYECRSMR